MENKRAVGGQKEALAEAYLTAQGCRILARNFRSAHGELDLVVMEEDVLVFVEVKYRKNAACGYPAEAVTPKKRAAIINCARYYLCSHGMAADRPCRFDVIAILGDQISHQKDAFWT